MRRSILSSAAILVLAFASQCLAEDGQTPGDQGKPLPVFRAKSNTIGINNLVRYNDSGVMDASVIYEDHTVGTLTLRVPMLIRSDQRIESRLGGSNTAGSGSSLFLGDSVGDTAGIQLSADKDLHFWMDNADNWGNAAPKMTLTRDGKVGIGTTTPGSNLVTTIQESPLHIYSAADKNTFLQVQNVTNSVNAMAVLRTVANAANLSIASHATANTDSRYGLTLGGWNEIISVAGSGLAIGTNVNQSLVLGTNLQARLTIDGNGNVTVGHSGSPVSTRVYGTFTADQVVGAVYQDFAEWVPATKKMVPGTVVVLNREHKNEVMPSAYSYDTAVAGVVSEQPGVILGVASDTKAQIATTGRVKVHVDATAGAIAIGDLLVTSDKPGTAMKSQPIDIGGVQIHRPGTVIGKALEPLANGVGEILVLLSLQ